MRARYQHPSMELAVGRRYAGAWVCESVRCQPRKRVPPLAANNLQAALAEVDRRCLARYGRTASAAGLTATMLAAILAASRIPLTAGQVAARLEPALRKR